MAFFDADLAVNNSKLPELEILGKKVEINEKKGILYLSRDDITIELTGVFNEKNGNTDGTVTQIVCKTGDDEPTWDISSMSYDFDKLFTNIGDGELKQVIEHIFRKKDVIWGSHFNDDLFGFKGKDEVNGWGGNDRINGGPGKDKLIGKLGDDTFVFDVSLKPSNVDRIKDFKVNHETVELDHKIFTAFEKDHRLHQSEFTIGKHAVGDDPQIVYKSGKGHLFYDADGEGDQEALKFATIGKDKDLTHDNFFVF